MCVDFGFLHCVATPVAGKEHHYYFVRIGSTKAVNNMRTSFKDMATAYEQAIIDDAEVWSVMVMVLFVLVFNHSLSLWCLHFCGVGVGRTGATDRTRGNRDSLFLRHHSYIILASPTLMMPARSIQY